MKAIPLALATILTLAPGARAETSPTRAFQPGERLTYRLDWLGIEAARAVMAVEGPIAGSEGPLLRFSARARSAAWLSYIYPVDDLAVSLVDLRGLFSRRFLLRQREGFRYRSFKRLLFEEGRVTYIRDERPPRTYKTPGWVQDALSALYKVRTMALRPGREVQVSVFDSKRNWRIGVVVHRREVLPTRWGPIRSLLVRPRLRSEGIFRRRGDLLLWLSDDSAKIPLQMKSSSPIGPFKAQLVRAEGVGGLLSRPALPAGELP
ncbi:MAG: DUF3108 domain-containing protein [Nitrospinota bacterium]